MPSALTRSRILIVDDDRTVSSPISLLLSHYEFDVTVASTLAEGMKQLATNPSLIILDLQLPDGNGLAILEKIRIAGNGTKVFVLTGDARPEVQRQIRRLVPDRCFMKPFNFIAILEAIRGAMEEENKNAPSFKSMIA